MLFCKICGDYIYDAQANQQLCQYCRLHVKRNAKSVRKRKRETAKRNQRDDRLNQFLAEAAQCGMSYGTYRAARRLGFSFDELKAN